jgi:hypothetical protein
LSDALIDNRLVTGSQANISRPKAADGQHVNSRPLVVPTPTAKPTADSTALIPHGFNSAMQAVHFRIPVERLS